MSGPSAVWACSKFGSHEPLQKPLSRARRPFLAHYSNNSPLGGSLRSDGRRSCGWGNGTENDHTAYRLCVRLGLEEGPAELHGQALQENDRQERSVPSPSPHARVGQRKPIRDPVNKWKQNMAGTFVKLNATQPATFCFQSQRFVLVSPNVTMRHELLHRAI
jgi:hypothetical protein